MNISVLYIVSPTRKYAGIERVVDEICDQLARRYGQELDITVLHLADYPGHDLGPRAYRNRMSDVKGRLDLFQVVRREIARQRYDIIVVPQIEATVLVWLASLGLKRRFVLYLHGNPAHENTHYKAHILFFFFRHWVLKKLTFVFGTSPRQLAAFAKEFPSRVAQCWTPNPVRRFDSVEPIASDRGGTVVFANVGRFCRQKGQDLLLDAFAQVLRARPHARLKLVGYGDEEADLTERASRLGLGDAVSFEHHPQDPQAVLRRADIYVSTSRWEGWSLAICEALRFGLPVVSTDCEFGPSDILIDPRLGTLVPPDDVDTLAAKMIQYMDNLETEKNYGAYRIAYVDRFDASVVVKAHAAALLSAAGSRAGHEVDALIDAVQY